MDLHYEVLETLKKFIQININEMADPFSNLTFLKFVFSEEFIEKLENYLDLDYERNRMALTFLKRNINEYKNRDEYDDIIYIIVDDYKKFFNLLNEIAHTISGTLPSNLINSIWLRMGVEDILDVSKFLEKQLLFIKNELSFIEISNLGTFNNYNLTSIYEANLNYFETNRHIAFSLEDKDKCYQFPVIHCSFIDNICYIYGIQNLEDQEKDIDIKNSLKAAKKYLRNSKVSPEFIMSLKLFIEYLKTKDIYDIRVPFLQIFNYPYHEEISKNCEIKYLNYSEDEKEKYENMDKEKVVNDSMLEYLYAKDAFLRFTDKEDLISKNKTERLIDTFMIMEEKYHNISFLNDPFIEGEELIVKVKRV